MKELYGSVQDPTSKTTLYPMYIISLQFPGDEIDVNLEPNKTQILMKRQVTNLVLNTRFNTCLVKVFKYFISHNFSLVSISVFKKKNVQFFSFIVNGY